MYSVFKNKKIWIENTNESPLQFCLFLNNDNILLVFENRSISIIDLYSENSNESIYDSGVISNQNIIDCKRIGKDKCAVITEKKDRIIFIAIDLEKNVQIKQVLIQNANFVQNLKSTVELVPFSQEQFVLMHRVYQSKIIYLYVFTKKQNNPFSYQTTIISEEIQWVSQNYDIIKPLPISKQFAIYPQRQTSEQVEWRMKLISIKQNYDNKIINLKLFLQNSHLIMDIIVRDTNQYYIFARKQKMSGQQMQIWRCRMYENQGIYVQSCDLLSNYRFDNINLMEIIAVNYKMNFFITKSYAHEIVNGQVYDNTIQIVNLQTGIILQKLYCNVKSYDTSLNQELILDYSQQINNLDRHAIHIRTLLTKKIIYYFLMQTSEIFKPVGYNTSFQSLVLEML